MKRIAYLALSLAAAGLMIMLLVMTIGAQAPDDISSTIIKIPDDYATIQAAIDAAADGDTIQVAEGNYKENLVIDKGLTLSGGWSADFTTSEPGASTVDGQGQGRVITINGNGGDTLVTIDGFTIQNGDATGLGVPEPLALSAVEDFMPRDSLSAKYGLAAADPAVDIPDLTEQEAQLRVQLSDLAARGLYPGGAAALQTTLEQLAWRFDQAEQARLAAAAAPTLEKDAAAQEPGAGGGVYSWNAGLHLLNSTIRENVASSNGTGAGGGVFVGQAPPSTVRISGNVVFYNMAGAAAEGRGGGLYLGQVPGAVVEDNVFEQNAAANGGGFGSGGAIYVNESDGLILQRNQIIYNTAHASWECADSGGGGVGGGVEVRASNDAIVADNVFHNNLAALHCGGNGGGLYLYKGENAQVSGNELTDNWSVILQVYTDDRGGGMGFDTLTNVTVTDNVVRGNKVSLTTAETGITVSYGGGIFGQLLTGGEIASNTITANTASGQSTGFGGGLWLEGAFNMALTGNLFAENVASLAETGGGRGGALNLRNTVDLLIADNQFQGNVASAGGAGGGGAMEMASWGPLSIDNTVDANHFLDNRASGDQAAGSEGGAAIIYSHGLTFSNNVVAGNDAYEAGGVSLQIAENGEVSNNTLVSNGDAAFVLHEWTTPVTFTNNIIVDHSVGISVTEVATATAGYTLWDGNDLNIGGSGHFTETHPVSGDPSFVDAANDDYHLDDGSAAIDAGDPAGVPPAPDHDADGVARPQGSAVDIGAYEWLYQKQYLPVVMNHWQPVIGWAVGYPADGYCTILKTIDGGDTWQRQGGPGDLPDNECGSVSAIDANNAWVVSKISILRTRDGGLTWETQALPDGLPQDIELDWIKALDGNTAWAVGTPDILLETTDGQTWSIMPRGEDLQFDTPVQYQDVDAVDATHVWAVGGRGLDPDDPLNDRGDTVIAFYDGVQWQRQGAGAIPVGGEKTLIGVSVVDENTVWAVGGFEMPLVKTTDGGATWQQVGTEGLNPFDTNRVVAVTADSGWVAADSSSIRRTDDGGQTWDNTNPGIGDYIYGITAMDMQTAWAVSIAFSPGKPGHLLRTKDGQNWEARLSPVEASLSGISFVGARR